MIIDLFLAILGYIGLAVASILPLGSAYPLPQGLQDALTFISTPISFGAAFLPSGVMATGATALTALLAVNLIVLPFLWARHFRLPFAGWNKG